MGVSNHDRFGEAPVPQLALPGSYGDAPTGYRLPDTLRLGAVRLQVSDLSRSVHWYHHVLGLHELSREQDVVAMGVAGADEPLVVLEHRPGTVPIRPGSRLGLYHFAILLPDRPALGRFVQHLTRVGARAAASDHLVSEALYLQDPDGLGIEVYRDRPRSEWRRTGKEIVMATDPLDTVGVVAAANEEPWTGMPHGTVMGHLHLHVGGIPRASEFYRHALGFDRTVWRYPGALFLGAGGYHHHLGTNTWARGASSPRNTDAQLLEWTIVIPGPEAALSSLAEAGFRVDGARALDPWGTPVRITG
ncbi:MAG: VOC family protein [Gemmatimonas sp.]|jgi:catechol 2,3-dioxygenase